MTELEMTEARHSKGKSILTSAALLAVAVLSVVLYLWLSFSPEPEEKKPQPERPWDLALTSVLGFQDSELAAVEALEAVGRTEPVGDSGTLLHIWIAGLPEERDAYDGAVSAAQASLEALAAERESARVNKILADVKPPEPDHEALAALDAREKELDARARELAQTRQTLDGEQAALDARETALDEVKTGLNQDGSRLNDAEAGFNAADSTSESMRRHQEQRDAWYAGGESYLDTLTVFEQARAELRHAERDYEAGLAALNAEREEIENERRALLDIEPVIPVIEDCTWQTMCNPDAADTIYVVEEEPEPVSPLRRAMEMTLLGVAALSVWLFFAQLLSTAAGSIVKPAHAAGEEESVASERKGS